MPETREQQYPKLTLETMCEGRIPDMVARELYGTVLPNLVDRNTDPTTPRVITVKIVVTGDKERSGKLQFSASATSKVASGRGVSGGAYVTQDGKEAVSYGFTQEDMMRQLDALRQQQETETGIPDLNQRRKADAGA